MRAGVGHADVRFIVPARENATARAEAVAFVAPGADALHKRSADALENSNAI